MLNLCKLGGRFGYFFFFLLGESEAPGGGVGGRFLSQIPGGGGCRRAKPGRFGSLAFAMKNRQFGGECWVFACVPNPGKQSIWRQCPPSARKQSSKKTAKSSRFCPCTGAGVLQEGEGPRGQEGVCGELGNWGDRVTFSGPKCPSRKVLNPNPKRTGLSFPAEPWKSLGKKGKTPDLAGVLCKWKKKRETYKGQAKRDRERNSQNSSLLGEDAPRVSSRWQIFLQWRLWRSFRWQMLSTFSWEYWQKVCHQNPPHFSLPEFQIIITLNFWDCFRVIFLGLAPRLLRNCSLWEARTLS